LSNQNKIVTVLLLSGCLGFFLGFVGYPTWQYAVEWGQVLSGTVEYSTPTPHYFFQKWVWNLLHQISAALLSVGVSEELLSLVFSGFQGMLSFQALSLLVFAFSRDPVLSLAVPGFVHFTNAVRYSVIYPISLMGFEATQGVVGLSLMLLIVVLIGNEQYKAAGVFLGLAPAVHPSLGVWSWVVVLICLAWDYEYLRKPFSAAFRYLLLGCTITLLSLGVHLMISTAVPGISSSGGDKYLVAFLHYWDAHRIPVDLRLPGVTLSLASLGLSILWLRVFRQDVPRPTLFILRAFVVSAGLALAFSVVSWLPPEKVPTLLLNMMPSRLFNLNILTFMALVIGLLASYRRELWAQLCLTGLVVILGLLPLIYGRPRFVATAMLGSSVVLVLFRLFGTNRVRFNSRFLTWSRAITKLVLWLIVMHLSVQAIFTWPQSNLRDWTNDPLFKASSLYPGMLLTCSDMSMIQVRTRKPVLLDAYLDFVPYFPELGPEMERILREVYGVDFFKPPPEAIRKASVPAHVHRAIWESRTEQQWVEIKRKFGVTQIMTYSDWKLMLPVLARNEEFVLYQIDQTTIRKNQ